MSVSDESDMSEINAASDAAEGERIRSFDQHATRTSQPHCQIESCGASILASVVIAECQALIEEPHFINGFSDEELRYALRGAKSAHALAARYAAKRGAESLTGLSWSRFEVLRSDEGAPTLTARDPEARLALGGRVALSITHDEPLALAYLVRTDRS